MSRVIVHADLDAFFAAVEQRDRPELRGQPVLVGGSTGRGVVAAASYEARKFGVHSAMPMAEALRLCPRAIVVGHDWDRYTEASTAFFAILGDFSPLVESLSVDEAFVDISGTERLLGPPADVAAAIKERVHRDIGLVVSVGVAPTKFAAKIASDIDKPDGLRVVTTDQLLPFLHGLPVARLWGVGKVTRSKLADLGLQTIGALARFPEASLSRMLGPALGAHLAGLARGEDGRDVVSGHRAVSIGHEETFDADSASREAIRHRILRQADRVGARLRRAKLRAKVVALKIKYADFQRLSRRRTLPDPTSDGDKIGRVATALLEDVEIHDRAGKSRQVRLCGISVSGLGARDAPRQLTLTEVDRKRGERLGDTLDEIQSRFGDTAIGRAIHTNRERTAADRQPVREAIGGRPDNPTDDTSG